MIGRRRLHHCRLWLLPSIGRSGRGTDGSGILEQSFKGGLATALTAFSAASPGEEGVFPPYGQFRKP
jgi:hypothetical protein